ncbi:MAG: diguanylate cyclase [Gemmatimonadetes bacterium]|jgi:two-component system cell cycle response regulator|nr:diguanylate cyclase [Gemmatimonadota bacterium]
MPADGGSPATATASKSRILVVDDHEDNIEVLRVRLDSWGYSTESAYNGEDALAMVEKSPPDLILLDVMMPEMDGNEVARRIKGNKGLPFIPIIMQTALDSTENKVEGLEAGADDYITKPIDFAELRARLRSMLRIKRLQEALEEREKELLEVNKKLTYMSQTDGLTGLDNRRHLNERIEEMFQHAQRLHEPFACVMCDLDKFKSVNDTYGHQAGDEVLKQMALILKDEAREIDRVGRYGGEEFMLLLPGTVLDAAVTFAERVRKRIEAHTFTFDGGTLQRTASFGVSGWPHPAIDQCDGLVRACDDALYVAKETGRNRVIRFDGDEFNAHHRASDDGAHAGTHTEPGPVERR